MPDTPAHHSSDAEATAKLIERLATPEELAEFGDAGPDPQTEAEILELLEAQMQEKDSELAGPPESPAQLSRIRERIAASPLPTVPPVAFVSRTAPVPQTQDDPAPSEKAVSDALNLGAEFVSTAQETERPSPVAHQRVDLLEFAETLDQHRMWVESGGEHGTRADLSGVNLSEADLTNLNLQGAQLQKTNLRGADLSMANLRSTNLVEADLRDANLLGTEFSGAILMGANLYGAQGLWAGRLGGTNLADATLPESVSIHDGEKTIAQSTQAARRFYLALLSFCVGALGLIALTTDVRLVLDEAAVPTSRIPNFLPLQGFYLGGPLLLTILYLRMQFLLLRLWGSIGALPAVFPDGQRPERDGSWYLMGPIRPYLRWASDPRSPFAAAESLTSMLLVYWAVPVTLFFFWLRYLVLQDYRGTLLQVFAFALSTAAAFAMPRIVARILRPADWAEETTKAFVQDVSKSLRVPGIIAAVMFLLSLGVVHGIPADRGTRPEVSRIDPRRWASSIFQSVGYRPYADITEEGISTGPAKEQTRETNRDAMSETNSTGPRLNQVNLRYARGYRSQFANARMWRANLEGASLAEANFQGANLREAVLRSSSLDRLQAAKSNLVSADARFSNLTAADFQSADLSFANFEGATLTTANFTRATAYAANLRQSNLLRADLSHGDFRDVKLEGAFLSLANLEQTDLSAAKLAGANLTGAQFKGTILLESDLTRADLRGTVMTGAILRSAKMSGALLDGADLRGALGLEASQVCSTTGWQSAQFDADVKSATDQLCGTPQSATAP